MMGNQMSLLNGSSILFCSVNSIKSLQVYESRKKRFKVKIEEYGSFSVKNFLTRLWRWKIEFFNLDGSKNDVYSSQWCF